MLYQILHISEIIYNKLKKDSIQLNSNLTGYNTATVDEVASAVGMEDLYKNGLGCNGGRDGHIVKLVDMER